MSIAEAMGWTSSGQRGSQSHSDVPQRAQKLRSAGLMLAPALAHHRMVDAAVLIPLDFQLAYSAPRFIA